MSFEKAEDCGFYQKDNLLQAAKKINEVEELIKENNAKGYKISFIYWVLRKLEKTLKYMASKININNRKK